MNIILRNAEAARLILYSSVYDVCMSVCGRELKHLCFKHTIILIQTIHKQNKVYNNKFPTIFELRASTQLAHMAHWYQSMTSTGYYNRVYNYGALA